MTTAKVKWGSILCLLITAYFCCPITIAMSLSLSGDTSEMPDLKVLTEITEQAYSQLIIRELGDSDLVNENYTDDGKNNGALPNTIWVKYEGSGMFSAYECPILWDYSSIDINKAGLQKIKGMLTPVNGEAVFGENLTDEIEHLVFFTTDGEIEDQLEFATAEYDMTSPLMLEKGGDPSALNLKYKTGACTVMPWNGRTLGIAYTMNYSDYEIDSVDPSTSGLRQLLATPLLANGINLPNGDKHVKIPVAIIDPTKIDFGGAVLNQDGTLISAQWIYIAENPIQPQYRIEEGEWINDTEWEWGGWKFSGYNTWSNGISINVSQIALETDYYFRILHDDKISETLHIYVDEYNFKIDPNAGGGDNDGSDRNETEMPDISQAPPTYSPDNSKGEPTDDKQLASVETSAIEPFMERVTATKTMFSGARMKHLLPANANYILFEKQGVALELTNKLLSSFKLLDDDIIEVTIEKASDKSFNIKLMINEKDILDIPESLLFIPWVLEEVPELMHIESGKIITPIIKAKVLEVSIDKTGAYELRTRVVSLPKESTEEPTVENKWLEKDKTQNESPTIPSENSVTFIVIAITGIVVISLLGYRTWKTRYDKK